MTAATLATVPQKRHTMTQSLQRIGALERAGALIGKGALAEAMGVPERTLRSYTSVERGLPDVALRSAADALEARCAEITAHVAKLRSLAEVGE